MKTEIHQDAAGWHVVFIKGGKIVGWSYNHATRKEAEAAAAPRKSVQFMGDGRGYEIVDTYEAIYADDARMCEEYEQAEARG
jgi:hypothetical protein